MIALAGSRLSSSSFGAGGKPRRLRGFTATGVETLGVSLSDTGDVAKSEVSSAGC